MAERNEQNSDRQLTIRHRGRFRQIGIFFRKFLRMFVYQNDWKVLPMASLIAGLVGFVLAEDFGVSMEGTLMGVFAIVCVCIWNGAFNSIQAVCRERDVIKREHRSGMHVSSYICAHMMYQLILCVLQTSVSLIVMSMVGMNLMGEGLFTPVLIVDIGITMLLVTYASDMFSLWISALVHTTTTAMTIMPFVLIFQLVFSGGLFALPDMVRPVMKLTISNPGINAMSAQVQLNSRPYAMVQDMLNMVDDVEIGGKITVGQVLDAFGETENGTITELRAVDIDQVRTIREVLEEFQQKDSCEDLRSQSLTDDLTVGEAVSFLLEQKSLDEILAREVGIQTTVGEIVDGLAADEAVREYRDEGLMVQTTLGDILDLAGREDTKALIEDNVAEKMYNADYAFTRENILHNWFHIGIFIVVFAVLSVITLEFVDKDKR